MYLLFLYSFYPSRVVLVAAQKAVDRLKRRETTIKKTNPFYCQVITSLVLIGSCFSAMAQDTSKTSSFWMDAAIRPRTEFRNGFKKLQPKRGANYALFTEQRSRLKFNFTNKDIKLKLIFQDVRIWGEVGQINKSDGLSSVHESWAQLILNPTSSLKLGRQELVYDDQRLLGSLGWAAQGRSHDAIRFIHVDSTWTLHIGGAYNQGSDVVEPGRLTTNFYAPNTNVVGFALGNPKDMEFVWLKKKVNKKVSFTALVLNTGFQTGIKDSTESVTYLTTVGLNPRIKLAEKITLFGSYYHQLGENVNAYLGSINLKYGFSSKLSITIGADILSGVDSSDNVNVKNKAFNVLFGTHHKFYGFMDYFYVGNGHGTGGLNDFYLKSKIKLTKKMTLLTQLHYFMTNASIADFNGGVLNSVLGTEVDFVWVYQYKKDIVIKAGYSQLFGTSTMEVIKGGSSSALNNWAWLMIGITPQLFKY
tara:strand:- start:8778 stop:10202 length:1425 start_codon:yes stop_codon:yes gene_type:complete